MDNILSSEERTALYEFIVDSMANHPKKWKRLRESWREKQCPSFKNGAIIIGFSYDKDNTIEIEVNEINTLEYGDNLDQNKELCKCRKIVEKYYSDKREAREKKIVRKALKRMGIL